MQDAVFTSCMWILEDSCLRAVARAQQLEQEGDAEAEGHAECQRRDEQVCKVPQDGDHGCFRHVVGGAVALRHRKASKMRPAAGMSLQDGGHGRFRHAVGDAVALQFVGKIRVSVRSTTRPQALVQGRCNAVRHL